MNYYLDAVGEEGATRVEASVRGVPTPAGGAAPGGDGWFSATEGRRPADSSGSREKMAWWKSPSLFLKI